MEDGTEFPIFLHITKYPLLWESENCVLMVSFKFARLSYRGNELASIIPMLLITDFPGFMIKIYAVNFENSYWQGMYQWKSVKDIKAYIKSFVFRIINRRSMPNSTKMIKLTKEKLTDFIIKNNTLK